MNHSLLEVQIGEAEFGSIVLDQHVHYAVPEGRYATLYAPLGEPLTVRTDSAAYVVRPGGVLASLSGRAHRLHSGHPVRRHRRLPEMETMALDDAVRPAVRVLIGRVPTTSNPAPDILPAEILVEPKHTSVAARLYEIFRLAMQFGDEPRELRAPVWKRIAEIIAIELTEFALRQNDDTWRGRRDDARIRHVVMLMRIHFERRWTLGALAAEARMSRSVFAQRFRAVVGVPPLQYLKRLRINRAAEMITTTDLPINRVAARVGYQTDSAFSRAFSSEMGQSPVHFRKTGAGEFAPKESV